MRMRPSRDQAANQNGRARWRARWLELTVAAVAAAVAAACLTRAWPAPAELAPLLAVAPALAGVGAVTVRRPLAYGAAALGAGVVVDAAAAGGITVTGGTHALPLASIGAVVVTTAVSAAGVRLSARRESTGQEDQRDQRIANVTSVAEAAQRAVLRPLPQTVGPLSLDVVYLAAAAQARVGGDLYEVESTSDYGIRLIIGDVRGKGLGAVEVAADIIGRFREVAHGVGTLNELAYRLDAGLSRRWGQHEEFVTAMLAQIDPERGGLTIVSCGHPPPLLISPLDGVTELEVRAPAPPLGLLSLGSDAGAKETYTFRPGDQLLLYTDGVTEARDANRAFYPLGQRVAALVSQPRPPRLPWRAVRAASAARLPLADGHRGGAAPQGLLDLVRDDLLRHVGAPPDDDAAMLLVRAPAAWPGGGQPAGAARRPGVAGEKRSHQPTITPALPHGNAGRAYHWYGG